MNQSSLCVLSVLFAFLALRDKFLEPSSGAGDGVPPMCAQGSLSQKRGNAFCWPSRRPRHAFHQFLKCLHIINLRPSRLTSSPSFTLFTHCMIYKHQVQAHSGMCPLVAKAAIFCFLSIASPGERQGRKERSDGRCHSLSRKGTRTFHPSLSELCQTDARVAKSGMALFSTSTSVRVNLYLVSDFEQSTVSIKHKGWILSKGWMRFMLS